MIPESIEQKSLSDKQPQAPIFLCSFPEEILLNLNEKLILTAECNAVPPANFKWSQNGKNIEIIENFKLINKINGSTLLVIPPIPEGTYQVIAINNQGQAEIHCNVRSINILDKNIPTDLKEKITKVVKTRIENEEIIEINSDSENEADQMEPHVFIKSYIDKLKPKETEIKIENVSKKLSIQSMVIM